MPTDAQGSSSPGPQMSLLAAHRPAPVWLSDLQKAKLEGNTGNKPKTTIQDLAERANDPHAPESALIPNSPRSVEACFRLGIDPVDLQYHPISYYRRAGEDEDIARIRYERNEAVRQERVKSLIDTRKSLVDEGWAPASSTQKLDRQDSSKGHAQSAMVEKERGRLEVLKRRQEKELQQMVQYEMSRKELLDKQQKKVDEMEKRAQALVKLKQENEAAWLAKQREFELQKLKEEKDLEREAKRMAEERYRREKEGQRKAEEEERRRKREAHQKELERRQKADEARRETEAILEAQAEEVRKRKAEMAKRDAERLKRMEEETKLRTEQNLEKRKKADARIQGALDMNVTIIHRKRSAFEQRETANERRRRELDEMRAKEEERKRQEEERKEQERQGKYMSAVESEEMRKMSIKQRAEEKDRMLAELYARRRRDNEMRKVEQEFQLKLRLDKVDQIQKTNLYHRQQLLEKIMNEYERTRSMMRERMGIQEQRKMANMTMSLQRQAMSQVMDSLRFTKSVDKLTGPGGGVNINDMLKRSRPATAM